MVEATEHHEIVLEVEGELRGLRKALDIMCNHSVKGCYLLVKQLLCDEIKFVEETLAEMTEDDDDESNSIR